MDFRTPEIQWPERLEPGGPADDPGILLVGEAQIGGLPFAITAIRMREGLRMPDYRDSVDADEYDSALDSLVDDIECLSNILEPSLLRLDEGAYLMWMVPSGLRALSAQKDDEAEPA